jgi:opacity protein-like surface antigen
MKRILPAAAIAVLFLAAAPARAQFPSSVPDTFRLKVGGMYAWFDTDVSFQEDVTGGGPIGPGISLEDVLQLPNSKPGFAGTGYWNFAGRSFIDFGYMYFSRTRTATLATDVVYGDTTYTVGAEVSTKMTSNFPFASYRYGFVKNDAMQLGLSLGVAWINLSTEVSASAGVVGPGGPIVGQSVIKTAKVSPAVPILGLMFDARIAENLSFGARVDGVAAAITPYSGYMISGTAHLDWFFAQNFGLGAGYNYTKFSIEKDDLPDVFIDYSYRFDGPTFYLILTF